MVAAIPSLMASCARLVSRYGDLGPSDALQVCINGLQVLTMEDVVGDIDFFNSATLATSFSTHSSTLIR